MRMSRTKLQVPAIFVFVFVLVGIDWWKWSGSCGFGDVKFTLDGGLMFFSFYLFGYRVSFEKRFGKGPGLAPFLYLWAMPAAIHCRRGY